MVARRFPPDVRSGTETVFENLYAQALARHEVRLVVGYTRARALVPAEALAVDLRGGPRGRAWAAMWWACRREVTRFRPDVVLSNSIEVPVGAAPVACIVHDLNFGRPAGDRGLGVRGRRLYYRLKARRLARIIAVSEAARGALLAAGMPADRTVAIRNGVDLERFKPGPDRGEGPFTLCYPSRILPGKGQHVAIAALAGLPREVRARVVLRLVGTVADPAYLARLRREARGLPVEIHLEVPDVVPFYQGCDAVLFPTLMEEGFGFTAVEGMACGKPVIWSDQPPVREATGGIGLPVPQGDAAALAAAIQALLAEPGRAARLGAEGRAFVAERYGWGEVWRRYEAVLEGSR
ncbi:MAG: glycosyltransferase family 4 protein [Pseudomonadota bacterium]